MSCNVSRQPFLYSANIGYFLQVSIHLLVAQHRQEHIFCYAIRLVRILVYQLGGRGYDGDVTHLFYFLAGIPNPQIILIIPYKMLLAKLLDIRKSHAGQAAESKDIPYLLQLFDIEILIHQPVECLPVFQQRLSLDVKQHTQCTTSFFQLPYFLYFQWYKVKSYCSKSDYAKY